jgi:hypothetical protein
LANARRDAIVACIRFLGFQPRTQLLTSFNDFPVLFSIFCIPNFVWSRAALLQPRFSAINRWPHAKSIHPPLQANIAQGRQRLVDRH